MAPFLRGALGQMDLKGSLRNILHVGEGEAVKVGESGYTLTELVSLLVGLFIRL